MSFPLRRVPFVQSDTDAVAAFCVAHGPFDHVLARRLLTDLTSDPAGVIVLSSGDAPDGAPAAVAVVIDRAVNKTSAGILELLGARRPLTAGELASLLVEPALQFLRDGQRQVLHVSLRAPLVEAQAESALGRLGFDPAYTSFTMCRPVDAAPPPEPPALAAGWRWVSIDDALVPATHALLGEAFAGAPSLSLSPLEAFRRAVATRATTWRLLLEGDAVRGLVQVASRDGRGEVRTVARAPSARGQGLGPRLVAEGLRVLLAAGPLEVELDVEARNDRALALYRGFGFEVTARIPVLGKALR